MSSDKTKGLEERVQDLEAECEIRNLIAAYLLKVDEKDFEGVAEKFAKDGVMDFGGLVGLGAYKGREAISKAFRDTEGAMIGFSWHLAHTSYIEVHRNKAIGHWGWTVLGSYPGMEAMEFGGVYEDEYVKTDEGWKIKKKVTTAYYTMDFGKWDNERFCGPTR
jgi:ketosteroid isomerase-like protein